MSALTGQSKRKAPVLPELNEFYRLTNEDHMIFRRRRVSVATQGAYHKADRADAHRMLVFRRAADFAKPFMDADVLKIFHADLAGGSRFNAGAGR
jgi:hypothetical protein